MQRIQAISNSSCAADPEEDLFLHKRGRGEGGRVRAACFPRIPDSNPGVSSPFLSPLSRPSCSNAEMHRDRRSFFRDILDSITENLVTLSTLDRISSFHFSDPQLRRVTGGLTTIPVFFARFDNAPSSLIRAFLIDFRRNRTKAVS